jgi:TonB family protein
MRKLAAFVLAVMAAAAGFCAVGSARAQDERAQSTRAASTDAPSQSPSVDAGLSDKELFDKATEEMKSGNEEAALPMLQTLLARYPFLQDEKRLRKLPGPTQTLLQQAAVKVSIIEAGQKYFANTGVRLKKIGHGVSAPIVTHQVDPDFSNVPKNQSQTAAMVNLIVDEQGVPQYVHVIRSAGAEMDAQTLITVKQYRFKPAMEDGRPVPVMLNIEVNVDRF